MIVVYKVDRLTRSLADFARIVDTLDKAGASFVSVTQAFNTTTSMGRLTLNVLLSFAQFEREVTSERIRDKVAASKKKGLWKGGPVPLGYKLGDRKLLVDDEEAEVIRSIYRRYSELRSVTKLVDALAQQNVRTKVRQYSNGRTACGAHFQRGSLSQLLQNPVYTGRVSHRGELYEGEHEAIISREDWDEVQRILAANRHESEAWQADEVSQPAYWNDQRSRWPVDDARVDAVGQQATSLLCHPVQAGRGQGATLRVPAGEIDRAMINALRAWLRSHEGPANPCGSCLTASLPTNCPASQCLSSERS